MSNDPTTVPVEVLLEGVHQLQTMGIAFLTLSALTVGLRMYVRIIMIKKFRPEDWAMVAGFLFSTAHIIISITNCDFAADIIKGNLSVLPLYTRVFRAAGVTYILTLAALKVSICFFFLHVFGVAHHRQRIAVWVIMISSVLSGLVYMPLGCFTCAQFKVFPGLVNHCPNSVQRAASICFVIFSITQIAGDIVLSLLGCHALWGANMPHPTKISAIFLLCLGSCGGVASTVRLYLFLDPANINTYTQQTMALVRCILIELGTCVIAANLAMVKPLFQAVLVRMGFISVLETAQGLPGHDMSPKTLRGSNQRSSDLQYGTKSVLTTIVTRPV
ncbi:hypothetical protein K461DRAFT_316039 [Myriangium duriaei CBS 260.36]|uniref:Rhodopsin domain-containing protein n=1 Tax=Myriangium duriaei CBS 260.36 TaxID=1168546 RepID=A0A9P4ISD2_9PEZI|nr:hypothetical protein K461DRAFT_316039 [Myriangium duriaei CBS 260.36]